MGALEIVDISAVGARLDALGRSFRDELLSQDGEPPLLRVNPLTPVNAASPDKPENNPSVVIELLNACAGSGCQLVANATVSVALKSGLRERFQVVLRVPLDGIAYAKHLRPLCRDLRIGIYAQLRARTATPSLLADWLMGEDLFYRDAAFRAVVDRKVVELSPQIAALMMSEDERVALLAVAAAGVLGVDDLLDPLEKISLGANPNIADAAMQALADIANPEALRRLERVGRNAPTAPMRERARELLGKPEDKVSPSPPSSAKDEAR